MMFTLNMLVQLVGIVVAVYLAFTRSFAQGVGLAVIVGGLHAVMSKLANLPMLAHQKTLSEDEQQQILGYGVPALGVGAPPLWNTIATVCGVLYFCMATFTIWFFLR